MSLGADGCGDSSKNGELEAAELDPEEEERPSTYETHRSSLPCLFIRI